MNIILQHWTGAVAGLIKLSTANVSQYAKKVGAEYRLLRGNVFRPNLSPPCQKLVMLSDAFDAYDMVVMLDADMFVRKGMTENVFTDVEGVGRHTACQKQQHRKLTSRNPLASLNHPYWGGAIYRLDQDIRRTLRAQIVESELLPYSGTGNFEDEGIMNRLATRAGMPITSKTYLPDGRWDCGNCDDGVELSAMIHIRHRMVKDGVLVHTPKIEVHADLVERGLIGCAAS